MGVLEVEAETEAPRPRAPRGHVFRNLLRRGGGRFGVVMVALLLLTALFAPWIAPQDPYAQDVADRFAGPSLEHLMGTDELGRDTFSRLVISTRTAMLVALPAMGLGLLLGVTAGLVAGYVGRWVDSVLVTISDTIQSLPGIVLALVVIALVGPSLRNVIIIIGLAVAPAYFRVTRASIQRARQEPYVDAERSLGAGTMRILAHILPNIAPPIIVLAAMDIPGVIAIDAGLSFLGLGVQPPTPSWGGMLDAGFENITRTPWMVLFPSLALALATLAFTFLGETLRDTLDPRDAEALK